jgi:hypothetical protein
MTIAPRHRPVARPGPEDLIREARRRQRRRQVVIVLVVVALAGSAAGVVAELGGRRAGQAGPPARTKTAGHVQSGAVTMPPLVSGTDTNLLMWPVGPAAFSAAGGPPARFEDLSTGRVRSSDQPAIAAGDFQPLLAATGRWLVYVGDGTTAIRDDLRGKPRVLAKTPFFAAAADPGRVWLFRPVRNGKRVRIRAWTESVTGGRPSRVARLPAGDYLPAVRGTDAGLLIQSRRGLALWQPGGRQRALPYSPNITDGFDATSRLVAYGTGCASHVTNKKESFEPNSGYYACRMLRILNVVTGKMTSVPAPAGTLGWVPNEFNLVSAFSPKGTMMAAYAAVGPAGSGRVRLYLVGSRGPATSRPVPSSAAFLFARTAWTIRGGWLLYQGPGEHLRAYQPSTGMTAKSTTPCCRYTVMVSVPSSGGAG